MKRCAKWMILAITLVLAAATASAQQVLPAREAYVVPKVTQAPVIDGDLSEYVASPVVRLSNANGTVGTYRMVYDSQALYIAVEVKDADLSEGGTQRDGNLWLDDALEFMIDTLGDGGPRMANDDFKLFINVAGVVGETRSRDRTWNAEWEYVVVPLGTINKHDDTDEGYRIEVRIPWAVLGLAAPPGSGTAMKYEIQMNDRDAAGVRTAEPFNTVDRSQINAPNSWGPLILQ